MLPRHEVAPSRLQQCQSQCTRSSAKQAPPRAIPNSSTQIQARSFTNPRAEETRTLRGAAMRLLSREDGKGRRLGKRLAVGPVESESGPSEARWGMSAALVVTRYLLAADHRRSSAPNDTARSPSPLLTGQYSAGLPSLFMNKKSEVVRRGMTGQQSRAGQELPLDSRDGDKAILLDPGRIGLPACRCTPDRGTNP
ncbi:hypothetical protein BJX70DRAFT_179218 [Aspergillus crustosus]